MLRKNRSKKSQSNTTSNWVQKRQERQATIAMSIVKVRVDFDNQEPASPADAAPISLAGLIQSTLPSPIKRKIAIKQARRFSEQIGHSLEFELA